MLKLSGCLLVGAVCIFAGFMKRGALLQRLGLLEDIETGLLSIENEIAVAAVPLSAAMECAGGKAASAFFKNAAHLIYEIGPSEGFARAVTESAFEKEEKEILQSFAAGLCAPCAEGQIKNIKLCRARLELLRKKTAEKADELGKLYISFGVMSATLVVILFI